MTVDHGQQTSTATSLFATVSSESNIDPVRFDDEQQFEQWKSSVAVSLRMPGGLSAALRETVWIALAQRYIQGIHLDWSKTCQLAFNPDACPDDEQLEAQIMKDLHRTGSHWSSNDTDRTVLKRVLLAFARYNKSIGYCQGFHILASVILEVVQMHEEHALLILIYLIDHVLPDFFSHHLHGLAIDMAVFDQWLKIRQGPLHLHLHKLRLASSTNESGIVYEPPLLNVFTIQWFLTMYATCLPREAILRVWDALMLEGNEILFRTGLILWSKLALPILKVTTADQFYSAMGHLAVQLLDERIIVADHLIREIYNFGPFPTPILCELRQKYSLNPTAREQVSNPSSVEQSKFKDIKRLTSKFIDEDTINFISCFTVLSSASSRTSRLKTPSLSVDVNQLRQDYRKVQQQNRQIQIYPPASIEPPAFDESPSRASKSSSGGPLINHLLVRPADVKRNQLRKHAPTKSSASEEIDCLPKGIEPSLTNLRPDKSTVVSSPSNQASATVNDPSTKNIIDRLVTSRRVKTATYSSFNPFPSRSFNESVAVNGYKLGLYSPSLAAP